MNSFDYNLLLYLNHIAGQFPILSKVIVVTYESHLQFALAVALIWWVWFKAGAPAQQQAIREKMVACLLGSLACIVVVRSMAAGLPFRIRPLADPHNGLHFAKEAEGWVNWSSFPSDNAAMFFMLAVCLLSASRVIGTIALVDTSLFICFPRVFVGVHYPTDVVAGAVIGIAGGYLVTRERVRRPLSRPLLKWMQAHPPSFYASVFMVSYLFADVFVPARLVLIYLRRFFELTMK